MVSREKPVASAAQIGFFVFTVLFVLAGFYLLRASWFDVLREANYRELSDAAASRELASFKFYLEELEQDDAISSFARLAPKSPGRTPLQLAHRLLEIAMQVRANELEEAEVLLVEVDERLKLKNRSSSNFQKKSLSPHLVNVSDILSELETLENQLDLIKVQENDFDRQNRQLRSQYTLIRQDLCELIKESGCARLEFEGESYRSGVLEFFPRLPQLSNAVETFDQLIEEAGNLTELSFEFRARFSVLRENAERVSILLHAQSSQGMELEKSRRSLLREIGKTSARAEEQLLTLALNHVRPDSGFITVSIYQMFKALA